MGRFIMTSGGVTLGNKENGVENCWGGKKWEERRLWSKFRKQGLDISEAELFSFVKILRLWTQAL